MPSHSKTDDRDPGPWTTSAHTYLAVHGRAMQLVNGVAVVARLAKSAEHPHADERTPGQIHGSMAVTLLLSVLSFTLLYVYLLDRRYRLAVLEEGHAERELEQASQDALAQGDRDARGE